MYRSHGKRCLDAVLAACGLAALSPVLLVLAVLVRLKLGRPVLFRQVRPGLGGRPFTLLKFRTMTDATNGSGTPLPDADRLTPFGRLLRDMSLDELPELINVLRGEMSLVGPRPLLVRYLDRYTPRQARRHEVRPGLTGWAQVRGRNAVGWEERLERDVRYVDELSLALDVAILVKTVGAVLGRRGVSAEGHATMPEFEGTVRHHSVNSGLHTLCRENAVGPDLSVPAARGGGRA